MRASWPLTVWPLNPTIAYRSFISSSGIRILTLSLPIMRNVKWNYDQVHSIFSPIRNVDANTAEQANLRSNVDIASLDSSGIWYCPQWNSRFRPIWVGVARSNVHHRVRGKMWRILYSYSRLGTQRIAHQTAIIFHLFIIADSLMGYVIIFLALHTPSLTSET